MSNSRVRYESGEHCEQSVTAETGHRYLADCDRAVRMRSVTTPLRAESGSSDEVRAIAALRTSPSRGKCAMRAVWPFGWGTSHRKVGFGAPDHPTRPAFPPAD